jgi:hypothetical protein
MLGAMRRRGLFLLFFLIGCHRCDGGSDEGSGAQSAEGAEAPQATEAEAVEASPPPRGVRLFGEPLRYREVAISLQVRGPDRVRLRRELTVERRTASGFERIDAEKITLRPSCEAEAPECIELAPGAELRPPPWSGELGEAQCARDGTGPASAGEYRFVATTCEGEHRIEGEPFVLGE